MTTTQSNSAVILATVLALGSSPMIMGADWPSFRGPTHDGKSAEAIVLLGVGGDGLRNDTVEVGVAVRLDAGEIVAAHGMHSFVWGWFTPPRRRHCAGPTGAAW